MGEWWYNLSFPSIALVVIGLQLVNLFHHWIVIWLKLRLYNIIIFYLKEAEQEQIRTFSVLEAVKQAISVVTGWAELARIQTSKVGELNKTVKDQVDANTGTLAEKIDKVPDKVLEKIHQDTDITMESGTFKKTK